MLHDSIFRKLKVQNESMILAYIHIPGEMVSDRRGRAGGGGGALATLFLDLSAGPLFMK